MYRIDAEEDNNKPFLFAVKKWFLTFAILTTIVILVLIVANADEIARENLKHSQPTLHVETSANRFNNNNDKSTDESNLITLLFISSVLVILFECVFLYGIFTEAICLTTAYTSISIVGTLLTLHWAMQRAIPWNRIIWPAVTTCAAIWYLFDLYEIRERQVRNGHKNSISNMHV